MFKKIYGKYLKNVLIFSIIIIIIYVILRFIAPAIVSTNLPFLITAFLLINSIVHYFIVKTDVERLEFKPNEHATPEEQKLAFSKIESRFITRYFLITTIKILGFLLMLGLYAYFNRSDFLLFAINFLVLYVLYSLFEILYLKKPVVGK